mmetsp:Transcript_25611/g.62812  ORF Transcript_25611/g.62812 Transcript_25611/m.62812 type:complete len:195 (-) Transcript_25611:382-966(-)
MFEHHSTMSLVVGESSKSFDSTSTYTPQKKKQKIHADRPPLPPTKTKRTTSTSTVTHHPCWPVEESRCCDQEARVARSCFPGRENNGIEGRIATTHHDTKKKIYHLTPTRWKSPLNPVVSSSGHKRLVDEVDQYAFLEQAQHHMIDGGDGMGRASPLDGLELLEMMSFDEGDDDYQGDNNEDDVSLSYSIASEG